MTLTSSDRGAIYSAFLAWAEPARQPDPRVSVKAARDRLRIAAARVWGEPATRLVAIAVVLCAVIAGFLAAFLVSRPSAEPALLDKPITIKRALSTTAALFGDRIDAEVDVYVDDRTDRSRRSVRVRTEFRPYRAVTTRVDRASHGDVSLLRSRIVLTCLTKACVPPRTARPPPPVRTAHGDLPDGTAGHEHRGSLGPDPALFPASARPDGAASGWATPHRRSTRDSRVSPALLRTLLILAAAILGLGGAALVVTGLWPRSFYSLQRRRRLSPLERSLLQVETAAQSERRDGAASGARRTGHAPGRAALALARGAYALARVGSEHARARDTHAPRETGPHEPQRGVASMSREPPATEDARPPVGLQAIPSVDTHLLAPAARRTRIALVGLSLARDRSRGRARSRLETTAGRPRGASWRRRADDRDGRLLQHPGLLGHDREVSAHTRERPIAAGRARPGVAERVRRPAARDSGLGAPRLAAHGQLHQPAEPQAHRQGEARPHAGPGPGARRLSVGRRVHGRHAAIDRACRVRSRRCATRASRHGQIVLISDLRDAPEDLPRVGALITRMHELGMKLRVVTVGNATRDPKAFSDLGGSEVRHRTRPTRSTHPSERRPCRRSPRRSRSCCSAARSPCCSTLAELLVPLRWRAPAGPAYERPVGARRGRLLLLVLAVGVGVRLPRRRRGGKRVPRHAGAMAAGLRRGTRCVARAGSACGRGPARHPRAQRGAAGLSGLPRGARRRDPGHGLPADAGTIRRRSRSFGD